MLRKDGPLIVQSDYTVLLDERHPAAAGMRETLNRFADLIKRPGDMHTYRITPLSLWNAASLGMSAGEMEACLENNSRYDVPAAILHTVRLLVNRYGKLRFERSPEGLLLVAEERELLDEITASMGDPARWASVVNGTEWLVPLEKRGLLKQELVRLGYPVIDLAGYHPGESLQVELLTRTRSGQPFALRDYQEHAVELFHREGSVYGGSGVLVLPCGSGKTVIGLAALARHGCATLILTTNATSVRQWRNELLDKTSLDEAQVGEYGGAAKEVRPVTIATYQIMTHRRSKTDDYTHMRLFGKRDWGLIIYDEVHLLPAPVFRMTADIQATRRLGLTATLVREDGREKDVFSLIGPKRFDLAWKRLEARGYIASVTCTEIRVPLASKDNEAYYAADPRAKTRLAAENPFKTEVVADLLRLHRGRSVLIIGQYLRQLHRLGQRLGIPVLTGALPQEERQTLYERFNNGDITVLIVSKVANFAVDLPDAAVAIQISGSYGSRQEEAQRIGRILRPKPGDNFAWFYTLVSEGTKETEFALKRRLFLMEQGYPYQLVQHRIPLENAIEKEAAVRL
jgi:DNA excision repair protein ERCC-3